MHSFKRTHFFTAGTNLRPSPGPERPAQSVTERNTSTAKVLCDGDANSSEHSSFHQSEGSVVDLTNSVLSSGETSWSGQKQRIKDGKQKRKKKSNSLKRTSFEYQYEDFIHPKTSGENVPASVVGGGSAATMNTHESGSNTDSAKTAIQTPKDARLERERKESKMTVVSSDQLLIACYWVATRCALWRSSPDSNPLMSFVQGLTDIVHIA